MTHRATLAAVVVLACSTVPLAAQARDTARFQDVLASRCPGAWVQVASGEAGRTRGLCESVGDGVLVLRSGGAQRAFPQARVDTVWLRSHAGGTGAAVGGLAGALVGSRMRIWRRIHPR